MGGSSSKEKRTKPQTNCKKSKKAKVKGKSAKAKGGKKGSAQWTRADGEEGEVTFTACSRKASEDTDTLRPPAMRARSKSLRFVDFTQLDRQRPADDNDLLPVDIAFFQEGKAEPEELCHVCSVYTGSETLLCGVCYRVFHEGCLAKIGQWSGPPDLLANSGMWSCHQCANLGNMLTKQEIIEVLRRLDKCGIRREDDMSLADYMAYCHMSLQEDEGKVLTRDKAENARRRFSQADTAARGRITWLQFLNIESVRILNKRSKNALVRLLTQAELERARDAFRMLDTDMDGRITKETAHNALDRNSRRSGYYPDETMMYIDEDLNDSISWIEFLRDRAIYIIAERPCLRASPLAQSTRRRSSNRSTIADATSLPATPLTKTPPLPHGKGVVRSMSQVAVKNALPPSPICKPLSMTPPSRHSDGASPGTKAYPSVQVSAMVIQAREETAEGKGAKNRSAPTSPTKKQFTGLPNLPSSASSSSVSSSRPNSSHHLHRSAASFPSTPVKTSAPEFPPVQQNHSGSAGQRLSGGLDSGAGGGPRRLSGQGEQQTALANPPRREFVRRSSQEDSVGPSTSGAHHVTGKPPMGSHGRAVAAPPYGKLVERVQKGEYRQTQARSLLVTSSPPSQVTPTFGHVTGDTSTGRRPLSLV
ncbi:uncharacterized protein LOC143279790 [Babylonia areolata]|uniref:uncharacterized protein LOC143279790 n=1 Tax=Babylonia areolata TaxID=304850 RepID=UPI003FCEED91